MRLQSGDRLGPYEIVAQVGAGGMGEVYCGRDTRLDRSVAIKVLPAALAGSAQFRERFEREARTISALAHPNICTLHDIGRHDGIDFLVMEYLEGETLADRLERGPLPLADVLAHGIQIADALDKAHRRGIVHRDLKPANVMLTRNGAKLLDFGLAKPSSDSAVDGGTAFATEKRPITEQGTILGTYQYMAPEQLEGLEADPRTDMFAFGALLYEMATGSRAFTGKTRTSLIAAIVSSQPRPISELQPLTPPALERLVQACLAKEPDDRWQSARDARLELETIAASLGTPAMRQSSRNQAAWLGWLAAAVVAALSVGWFVARGRGAATPQLLLFEIAAPAGVRFNAVDGPATISPDGTKIVLRLARDEGRQQLYLRSLDSAEFQPLRGTQGAFDAFWSPDGRQIGFFADGKVRRLDLATSTVTTICSANDGRGATWAGDTILLTMSSLGPIYSVPASGGTPKPVTRLDAARGETAHWRPSFLPDGRQFLFIAMSENSDNSGVYLGSLDSPDVKRVLNFPTAAVFVEPGHLLYVNETDLYAQPFDRDRGAMTGEGTLIARSVDYGAQFATSGFSVARNGMLVYHRFSAAPGTPVFRIPIDGEAETLLDIEGVNLDLSRDGASLALMRVESQHRNTDIWTYDLRRKVATRVTFEPAEETGPVWSKDGRMIAHASMSAAGVSVVIRPSAGGGTPQTLLSSGSAWAEVVDWSPDGRTLLAEIDGGATRLDVVTIDVASKAISSITATPFVESSARFSPDGKWIAYRSDESGRGQIYVQPFPPDGSKWQVSADGGEAPRWSGDGKRLFYVDGGEMLASVEVDVRSGLEVSAPRRHRRIGSQDYVLTPDASEVVVSRRGSVDPQPVVVISDWRPLSRR